MSKLVDIYTYICIYLVECQIIMPHVTRSTNCVLFFFHLEYVLFLSFLNMCNSGWIF